jgi:hypothetical protein
LTPRFEDDGHVHRGPAVIANRAEYGDAARAETVASELAMALGTTR